MRTYSRRTLMVLVVVILVLPRLASAQSALAAADAAPFMGGWTLGLDTPQGSVSMDLTIKDEAGDFIFIEPGIPHEVFNVSDTEPVVAVVARSDASEWEHIIPFTRPPASRVS